MPKATEQCITKLLGNVTAITQPDGTTSLANQARVGAGDAIERDGDLIAACDEYLTRRRKFDAYFNSLPGDPTDDDPVWGLLEPLAHLTETIVRTRAFTAEGYLARARCVACHYLPNHPACRDNPLDAAEDRFQAATLRDLLMAERAVA